MELTLESNKSKNFIKNYEENKLYIGDKIFDYNLIITTDKVNRWEVNDITSLSIKNLSIIIEGDPEIIIIGTGERLILPAADITSYLIKKKIGIEYMITESACKTFNVLISEGRRVSAALII